MEGTIPERDVNPYTSFVSHLYVYPQSLNFDNQKTFARARNIACVVELRDTDKEEAKPLCVSTIIYIIFLFMICYSHVLM